MALTIEELKELIIERYDPDLLVEILEITTEELVDLFHDRLVDRRYKFLDLEED